jgi:hypothetical protein
VAEVPDDEPRLPGLALRCQGGDRMAISASALR